MSKERKPKDYRLIFYDDNKFKEMWSFKVTTVNIIAYVGLAIILIGVIVALVLIYTPLSGLLPNKVDNNRRNELETLVLRVDSLEDEIQSRISYLQVVESIMNGEPQDIEVRKDTVVEHHAGVGFKENNHDSLLHALIVERENNAMPDLNDSKKDNTSKIAFFKPINGTLTQTFDSKKGHLGIDIAAKSDEPVLATLSGTITFASFTGDTGNVIFIQHENNTVSIYKHCKQFLKGVGQKVVAGEPIAIVGSSGEYSTGVHLHFELWVNGVSVDPWQYLAY